MIALSGHPQTSHPEVPGSEEGLGSGIEIQRISHMEMRSLRPGEESEFLDLMLAAFGERDLFARYLEYDELLGCEDTRVIFEQGRIVSALQIFTRRIRLGGRVVSLGGIGSVATHPDYEHRGFASRLLRSAVIEMRARGMMLSLLFTGRTSFYERLGWIRIPHSVRLCGKPRESGAGRLRPALAEDLPAILRLYERYCRDRDCTTSRDAAYWRGQLRFAGTPDEDFRVALRGRRVVAYARGITLSYEDPSLRIKRIMEYAREDDAAEELAELLVAMAVEMEPLYVSAADDSALEEACRTRFRDYRSLEFGDQMWRVLDVDRMKAMVGTFSSSDQELLEILVGGEQRVFWPTDRF
jgi:predicted acetyltransferase